MNLGNEPSKIASILSGKKVVNLIPLYKGGNNQLYKVIFIDNSYAALKCYASLSNLGIDRLSREYKGLNFLSKNGIHAISKPIACHEKSGCALYQWIEGEKIKSLTFTDIDFLLTFLKSLHALTKKPLAKKLLNAKDASLSGESLNQQIKKRIGRLQNVLLKNYSLLDFLNKKFFPIYEILLSWARARYKDHKMNFALEIDIAQRTLSPSDFGFHNALRLSNNSLVFLDFEYFGWDDPVAMASDFLWHPAMSLTSDLQQRFIKGILKLFQEDEAFVIRFRYLYPLFGLVWVLILLNEFIPEICNRRIQAGKMLENECTKIQARQLQKANIYLENAYKSMEKLPYVT